MNQPKPIRYPAGFSAAVARRTVVALGCACLAACVGRAAAPDRGQADVPVMYSASGEVRVAGRPLTGGGRESRFAVAVSNQCWLITLERIRRPVEGTNFAAWPDRWVAAFDGDHSYKVEVWGRPDAPILTGNALRHAGNEPVQAMPELYVIWYAYASHAYWRTLTNQLAHPLQHGGTYEEYAAGNYRKPARWLLESHPPGLPAWVAFGTEAARFQTLAQGDTEPLAGHELTVTGWTNVGPWQLPVRVEAQFFLSLAGRSPWQTIRVEGDAFGAVAPAVSFAPPLDGDFHVSDSSMWDPQRPISVVIRSNAWPAIEDFTRLRASRLAVRGSLEAKRTAFTLLLAAILILPLLFRWLVNRSRKE